MSNTKRASKKSAAVKKPAAKRSAAKKPAAAPAHKSKKAVKKTATKKVTSKRSTTAKPSTKEKPLVHAKHGETFWATDGQIIADLLELKEALARMTDNTFAYHVTKQKNDFADWVELALRDRECADALRRSRKRNTAHAVVVRQLKFYTY